MRPTLTMLVIIILLSCNNNTAKPDITTHSHKVQLIDSLGQVSINLPVRYDTFFSWMDYSDCTSCGEVKYRYQPKTNRITKESGFIWLGEPMDSIDKFTIALPIYHPFFKGNEKYFKLLHEKNKYQLKIEPYHPVHLIFDTVERINGRLFSIIVGDSLDKIHNRYSKTVTALTTIKSNELSFRFELVTKPEDTTVANFIKNSIYSIRTIRIEKGL